MFPTQPPIRPLRERDVFAAERFHLDTYADRRAPARPPLLRRLLARLRHAPPAAEPEPQP